jgi:DNA repair exonuclease SbcCD ATPase subunit
MAKGKHAAAKNAQRLRDAEERLEVLEADLSRERAEAHQREEELKAEVQALKGRLVSDVDALANDRVASIEARSREDLREAERRRRESLASAFRFIEENAKPSLRLSMENYAALGDILGVTVGEMGRWGGVHQNRRSRRTTNARARHVAALERQVGL